MTKLLVIAIAIGCTWAGLAHADQSDQWVLFIFKKDDVITVEFDSASACTRAAEVVRKNMMHYHSVVCVSKSAGAMK